MDKKYKTRDGREVKIYSVEGNCYDYIHGAVMQFNGNWELRSWYKNGKEWSSEEGSLDLIEVKERKKIESWANIYPDGAIAPHPTKEKADNGRASDCFACVKITIDCEEGEGL